ncbi:hypothetical protein GCM10010156_42190 [Planobispora rosea]|uniref:RNA polymerase sigma factor 70 region 4 type 2 domain-containing protein n=1 Tax=Planobispora rosea TaxID=35762 RepID=A0A8J3WE15_PLARO|nr:sigma-70 family RNA polymerase sigma factor [Planobispora rosea]GGS78998.1 hypothetical protein GCM10010156_42190 [Planobispora rosea]GIH85743.1 hypothetical protein Pro02_41510 [Planobispora rosea]
MPVWPTVGRADDQRLAQALRRADTQAPASLFDAYAERLNDYACSLLSDRDGAAEAVHDALVTAQGCAHRLGDPSHLRAWLYALVRFQCAVRASGRPPGGQGTTPLPVADGHDDPREREMAALVQEALAELGGQEREILELALRHGLSTGEIGALLGLTSRQVTARLDRARTHLENTAAAVVLARVGRAHCPDLSAMVDSWEGPLPPVLRRRLSGHIARCEVCTEQRDRHVSAGRLLDLVPVVFPPLSLRRRVIETCVNPELDGTRTAIVEASDRFGRDGFPAVPELRTAPSATSRASARRRRQGKRSAPVAVAAACVLAATAGVILVTGQDLGSGPARRAEAAPGSEPGVVTFEPEPGTPAPDTVSPAESPEPDPTPPPEPTESGTPASVSDPARTPVTAGGRRPSTQRPRSTRTPAPRLPAGRLTVSCPPDIDQGAGQIRLTARDAAVTWSATASGALLIHPQRGRLRAGAGGVIWVTVADPSEAGSGTVSFRSPAGGSTCSFAWEAPEPPESEPPTDPPPTPTESPSADTESDTVTP